MKMVFLVHILMKLSEMTGCFKLKGEFFSHMRYGCIVLPVIYMIEYFVIVLEVELGTSMKLENWQYACFGCFLEIEGLDYASCGI